VSLSVCAFLSIIQNNLILVEEQWAWGQEANHRSEVTLALSHTLWFVPSIYSQRLRSASFTDLMVPRTIRSTIGERSFQSAAASTWNALPRSVRSSTSVLQFRSRLKTELFARSYQQSYWICLCVTVTQHFCSVILKISDLCHVNDDSNTN